MRLSTRTAMRLRARRATALLEFCLLLPAFVFMIAFLFDMSRIITANSVAQESAYRSARAVAARGNDDYGSFYNSYGQQQSTTISSLVFDDSFYQLSGGGGAQIVDPFGVVVDVSFTGGYDRCVTTDVNDVTGPNVTVEATYGVRTATPGLGALFGLLSGDPNQFPGEYPGRAAAVARCQVSE